MKGNSIALILAVIIVGGTYLFLQRDTSSPQGFHQPNTIRNEEETVPANNVSIANGKQIIELRAKGGYQPRKSIAKSGVPTVLRIITSGTFDCSSSIRIPSMGISKILPQTGTTDIELGTQTQGTLRGSCGMGMYPFEIQFQG